jgi:hypothetical protein
MFNSRFFFRAAPVMRITIIIKPDIKLCLGGMGYTKAGGGSAVPFCLYLFNDALSVTKTI